MILISANNINLKPHTWEERPLTAPEMSLEPLVSLFSSSLFLCHEIEWTPGQGILSLSLTTFLKFKQSLITTSLLAGKLKQPLRSRDAPHHRRTECLPWPYLFLFVCRRLSSSHLPLFFLRPFPTPSVHPASSSSSLKRRQIFTILCHDVGSFGHQVAFSLTSAETRKTTILPF